MLRLAGARLLDDSDYPAVRAALAADPVGSCMVSARVEVAGLDPWRLGGELWGADGRTARSGALHGLCFSGPNMIPLRGNAAALRSFADRALRRQRTCSSLVGPSEQVLGLWDELVAEWGPAREVRHDQPLMALDRLPAVPVDREVRPVRPDELDRYLPAAIAMFVEEVGVDPRAGDGGASYRARVAELIAGGRAFARFENGEVVFKAEIGALSETVGQIQGVWVHPDRRGHGLGSAGTAAVSTRLIRGMGRVASLYVNSFNSPALAAYRKIGFRQVGRYATVLF
ncbi:GNAT family N-acetyltransferase [Prauserella sp. PE36]|uniref:GNAT family N-acetyltransferase n=1 Tax=Prauserella sp. PE36 TaxID=1504709 RepID=UPI000D980C48|nr:GNAT family N-acetyltransferase [Prauserella sp. PE36]PXY26175.1 GCN5 family acetyltransferase [Prauserella coralliicola]RBM19991.1 GNAT family N-acetyltransferase [Prauserella sp. PE36]